MIVSTSSFPRSHPYHLFLSDYISEANYQHSPTFCSTVSLTKAAYSGNLMLCAPVR